ncbi:autotransporter outer membrane beta-barrel domain-containing protein [Enterobacter sp. KBR-315C3_2022]|uniref:autotransporter outer membrane beta-barrel domain-containing protein n=1 Tax=Enterobacter sp. KBR-315C3_2022 TaxID=3242494 RepID=UPI003527FF93
MNKQYNIVWNSARNMYVVASELARGDSRIKSRVRAGGLVAALILASGASNAADNSFVAVPGENTIGGSYSTSKDKSTAVYIAENAIVEDADAVTIMTKGEDSYGLYMGGNDRARAELDSTHTSITTYGKNAHAVFVSGNASLTLDGGTITTYGDNAYGVMVDSGTLSLSNVEISGSSSALSRGIVINSTDVSAGKADLKNVSIHLTGPMGMGIWNIGNEDNLLTGSAISIDTSGDNLAGVTLINGFTNLDAVTIITTGTNSGGVLNESPNSTLTDIRITTSGDGANGIKSISNPYYGTNSVITLDGGTINTSGANAHGMYAIDGGKIIASNLDITGAQSYGTVLENGSSVAITSSNVTGAGAGYYFVKGKKASATPNALTLDGGSITTTTDGGSAFLVDSSPATIRAKNIKSVNSDNLLTVNNTTDTVTFTAENSLLSGAVDAGGSNVSMALDNASQWIMSGSSDVGNLTSSGRITLGDKNGNSGTLNAGNLTLNDSSTTDVWLSSTSEAAPITAQQARLGGTLNITGFEGIEDLAKTNQVTVVDAESAIAGDFSSVTTAGMDKADFLTLSGQINSEDNTRYDVLASLTWFADSNNAATPAHGTFTIDDADQSFTLHTVLRDQSADAATGWDGKSLVKEGDGTLVLDAENRYSGDTHVNGGTLWITDQGAIGAEGSDRAIYVAQGATFGGQNGTANAAVMNNGTVKFDDTLTLNGNVTNAGVLSSGDASGGGSAAGNTLIVNGDYSGKGGKLIINTQLGDDSSLTDRLVVNGDTSGDTTVHINNAGGNGAQTDKGIKIIDVAGASNGEFTQGNQVQINAYEYRMYKDEGDWYLRSAISGADDGSDGGAPQYRADIGAYLGNQSIVQNLQMQTLYDREGSQFRSDNGAMWARFKAGENGTSAAGGDVDVDGNYAQFQIGGDIAAWNNGKQSLSVGVMASYVNAKTDSTGSKGADGSQFTANGSVNGYSLGMYATWFADAVTHQGAYVDSWYQYGIYNNSVKNGDLGSTDYDSTAHAVSLETGYRYDLGAVSLTPQAQAVWQKYSADGVKDSGGTMIDGQDSDSLTTRLGLRVDSKLAKGQSGVIQPFAEANWLHASHDAAVTFGDTRIAQDRPADRAELKVGIQANVNKQWSITAQAAGQKGGNDYSDMSGSLNVRYSW